MQADAQYDFATRTQNTPFGIIQASPISGQGSKRLPSELSPSREAPKKARQVCDKFVQEELVFQEACNELREYDLQQELAQAKRLAIIAAANHDADLWAQDQIAAEAAREGPETSSWLQHNFDRKPTSSFSRELRAQLGNGGLQVSQTERTSAKPPELEPTTLRVLQGGHSDLPSLHSLRSLGSLRIPGVADAIPVAVAAGAIASTRLHSGVAAEQVTDDSEGDSSYIPSVHSSSSTGDSLGADSDSEPGQVDEGQIKYQICERAYARHCSRLGREEIPPALELRRLIATQGRRAAGVAIDQRIAEGYHIVREQGVIERTAQIAADRGVQEALTTIPEAADWVAHVAASKAEAANRAAAAAAAIARAAHAAFAIKAAAAAAPVTLVARAARTTRARGVDTYEKASAEKVKEQGHQLLTGASITLQEEAIATAAVAAASKPVPGPKASKGVALRVLEGTRRGVPTYLPQPS